MATIPMTEGFRVSAMPGINYIDPRMFDSGLRDVVGNVGRGREVVGRFAQLAEEAEMRPVRERMAQLQIQAMEQQGALNRLRMLTPIETVIGGGIEEVPRYPLQNAILEDGTVIQERPAGSDIFETQRVRVIDPSTGAITETTRRGRPLQTVEQIDNQRSLMDQREAMAESAAERARIAAEAATAKAETDRIRAENDRIKADAAMTRAESLQNNPQIGFVDVKRADGRTYRQYFNKSAPQQILHEVDRGTLSDSFFAPGAIFNVQPGAAGAAPSLEALASRFQNPGANIAARPPRAFTSEAEVEQAAAQGLIRPGDKIIVNGRSATYR